MFKALLLFYLAGEKIEGTEVTQSQSLSIGWMTTISVTISISVYKAQMTKVISEFGQQAVNTVSCCVPPTLAGRYCGSYMDHQTIFRVPSPLVHIQLQCSSRLSDKPLLVEYGSYNISQRKMEISPPSFGGLKGNRCNSLWPLIQRESCESKDSPNVHLQNVELHTESYWKHGQKAVSRKGNV